MKLQINQLFLALLGVLLIRSAADAVTIDFDSLPGMTNAPATAVPAVNQLSDAFLLTDGLAFNSAAGYVAVIHHAPNPTVSLPNVIGGTTMDGLLSYGTELTIAFFDPTSPTVETSVDFVSIRGDKAPIQGGTATMEAFDVAGEILGSVTDFDSTEGLTLCLNIPGIHLVRLTQDSASAGFDGTIGFDDLTFNRPVLDSDQDGISDANDNCVDTPNPTQRDTNGDGFGNLCDADLNNDCIVNVSDLGALKTVFFSNDPDADLNGDGVVNAGDLGLMKLLFFAPPGPASVPNDCERCLN